jgi:hypothetical protein
VEPQLESSSLITDSNDSSLDSFNFERVLDFDSQWNDFSYEIEFETSEELEESLLDSLELELDPDELD